MVLLPLLSHLHLFFHTAVYCFLHHNTRIRSNSLCNGFCIYCYTSWGVSWCPNPGVLWISLSLQDKFVKAETTDVVKIWNRIVRNQSQPWLHVQLCCRALDTWSVGGPTTPFFKQKHIKLNIHLVQENRPWMTNFVPSQPQSTVGAQNFYIFTYFDTTIPSKNF